MEKFILTAETITLDDGNYNIMAMPNEAIHHYMHTYKYVESASLNQTLIDDSQLTLSVLFLDFLTNSNCQACYSLQMLPNSTA